MSCCDRLSQAGGEVTYVEGTLLRTQLCQSVPEDKNMKDYNWGVYWELWINGERDRWIKGTTIYNLRYNIKLPPPALHPSKCIESFVTIIVQLMTVRGMRLIVWPSEIRSIPNNNQFSADLWRVSFKTVIFAQQSPRSCQQQQLLQSIKLTAGKLKAVIYLPLVPQPQCRSHHVSAAAATAQEVGDWENARPIITQPPRSSSFVCWCCCCCCWCCDWWMCWLEAIARVSCSDTLTDDHHDLSAINQRRRDNKFLFICTRKSMPVRPFFQQLPTN